MEINRTNIVELVNRCNVKPDKDYGQNFLIEPTIAERIVAALGLDKEDCVLEIGPGLGSLTHFMVGNCHLDVCDIDSRMIDFLKVFYKDDIAYILNDVRKVDISRYNKIIGNLPYNITTELVAFLLLNSNASQMVLMCQSEAFARFYETSGEKYGPLGVLLHLLGDSKKLLTVKPGSFYPAPKCDSTVFVFTSHPICDKETIVGVYKMCKTLFLNRRKTILNNLKFYSNDTELINEVLNKLKIETNKRPENIQPEEYLEMYRLFNLSK